MKVDEAFAPSDLFSMPSITHYGVSEQLRSEFDMLREVSNAQGYAKYSTKTVHVLAQHIVCRHYGNLCYELAHLNWAILHADKERVSSQALLNFYWISGCSSSQKMTQFFAQRAHNCDTGLPVISVLNDAKIEVDTQAIRLSIYDHVFVVNGARSNLLSMEWLVVIIPDLLTLIATHLHGKGLNAIKTLASEIQKQIYAYLGAHMPPAKLQQRHRLLSQWHQEKALTNISDDSILQFWQQYNTFEGYVKFSHVVTDILGFMQARDIAQAQTNLTYATSTTNVDGNFSDINSGENSLENDREFGKTLALSRSNIDLHRLMQNPKALNKQQVELVTIMTEFPEYIMQVLLSYLRVQTFGKRQHQMIQAQRVLSKNHLKISTDLLKDIGTYQDVLHQCVLLQATNQQSLLAIAQLLLNQEQYTQACLILLKLSQQIPSLHVYRQSFAALLDGLGKQGKSLSKTILNEWQLAQPAYQQLVVQSKLALKQINRSGFTSSSLLEPDDYIISAELLFDLNVLLTRVISNINKNNLVQQGKFEADRLIFTNEFHKLYTADD